MKVHTLLCYGALTLWAAAALAQSAQTERTAVATPHVPTNMTEAAGPAQPLPAQSPPDPAQPSPTTWPPEHPAQTGHHVEASASKPRLQWCLDHLPPRHSYLPGQQPQGPMVDMMQELARRSGFELTFSPPTPIPRCLKLLEQGKTDLMTGLVYSEQRASFLFLYPFDEVRMASLFVRRDGPQLYSEADLKGRTVAMSQDRVYPASIVTMLQHNGAQIVWGKDLDTALALLLYQQTDFYAGPQHYTELQLLKNQRFGALKRSEWQMPLDAAQQNNLGLARQSRHATLAPVISEQLQQMRLEGKTRFY